MSDSLNLYLVCSLLIVFIFQFCLACLWNNSPSLLPSMKILLVCLLSPNAPSVLQLESFWLKRFIKKHYRWKLKSTCSQNECVYENHWKLYDEICRKLSTPSTLRKPVHMAFKDLFTPALTVFRQISRIRELRILTETVIFECFRN